MFRFIKCSILLFGFFFLINSKIWSQKSEWFDNSQILDHYDPTDIRFHRYEYKTLLCTLNGKRRCNIDSAFKLFLTNSKFVAPTYGSTKVEDGSIFLIKLSLPGFDLPGLHPIKTKFSIKNHLVINFTLPGHALHPGMVERKIVQVKDSLFLLTTGIGYNNISQFFTQYNGSCIGQSNLELAQTVTDIIKSAFENKINNALKNINQFPCIAADVWEPVHNLFTLAFKDYINHSESIVPPVVKDNQPSENNQQLVGGATPEELGKTLLKAIKTNDKKLWLACFLPKQGWSERREEEIGGVTRYERISNLYAKQIDYLREKLEERGFSNFAKINLSRITFKKEQNDGQGYLKASELFVSSFYIEFTYGTEFVGRIGDMYIGTYKKGNYFVFSQGGLLETDRR